MRSLLALIVGSLAALAQPAAAQEVRLEGYLIALSACEANRKKESDNPGNVRLEAMRAYRMLARNSTPGTHYRIVVPAAPDGEARWVPMGCGAFAPQSALILAPGGSDLGGGDPGAGDPGGGGQGVPTPLAPDSIEAVFAASWQPGFCATPAGRDKAECLSQTAERFDATHFSLHGLWPDDLDDKAIFPCYCDRGGPVSCRGSQRRDDTIDLSDGVRDALQVAMPGMQSDLHMHEWAKHGACYEDDRTGPDAGADPDEFFGETMGLLAQLNASPVQALFAGKLGQVVSRQEIEAAFDQAFGAGAGERVLVRCKRVGGDNVVTELWISLKGAIDADAGLAGLIGAAPETRLSTDQRSCNGGLIVKVGGN